VSLYTPGLQAAFARCREIARAEAKNFYFAFLALPRTKSDAMCAMYAFMRRADDIADDELMPVAKRRELMARWLAAFHASSGATEPTLNAESALKVGNPGLHAGAALSQDDQLVFVAVRETQRRFGIADTLLDELVAGTAMDLAEELPAGVVRVEAGGRRFDCYQSVESLDRYCYLVASVVGLVTVRIFGVQGTAADADAVRMGKAFQYTNILRDVREDAERGRVYLPLDVLATHGAGVADVATASGGGAVSAGLQAAMVAIGVKAEDFYGARRRLVPLLDRDSRPAMRVLIRIYQALLLKLRRKNYAVFGNRVSVSTARKLGILLRGLVSSLFGRFG
jgi:phytoene synthase